MTPDDKVKNKMKDFKPAPPDSPDLVWSHAGQCSHIDHALFPVPNLLLFLLNGICGLPLGYRGDKIHWIVPFTYKGINYALSNEKFGLRFYAERGTQPIPKEILNLLRTTLDFVEKNILNDIAKKQISDGDITIPNQFNRLSSQYFYFRNQAKSALLPANSPNLINAVDFSLAALLNSRFNECKAGSYNALAMIDAYFSRLEHFLVIALPFASYQRDNDSIIKFVGMNWSDKIRRVLDLKDKTMHKHYQRMVLIKEKYRNTFSHGGFEKNGQSFHFHLGKFGLIPASMSGIRNSVHFNVHPIDKDSFELICKVFDDFDIYLRTTAHEKAWKFAISNLSLSMDDESLSELLHVADDPEAFDSWINEKLIQSDIYDNVDY